MQTQGEEEWSAATRSPLEDRIARAYRGSLRHRGEERRRKIRGFLFEKGARGFALRSTETGLRTSITAKWVMD